MCIYIIHIFTLVCIFVFVYIENAKFTPMCSKCSLIYSLYQIFWLLFLPIFFCPHPFFSWTPFSMLNPLMLSHRSLMTDAPFNFFFFFFGLSPFCPSDNFISVFPGLVVFFFYDVYTVLNSVQ